MTTSAIVATIKTDESATITIQSTGDYARFTITFSDTATALIKFVASPNFEIPVDAGGDNIYNLTLNAVDSFNNSQTQNILIQVLDVNENPTISGTADKGLSISITLNVGAVGKVRFIANGKKIPNCLSIGTSGSLPSVTATCSWKPNVQGRVSLVAVTTPTNGGLPTETSSPTFITVYKRTNSR